MYFICRVVIGNYFGWVMMRAVLAESSPSVSNLTLHLRQMLHDFCAHWQSGLQEGQQFLACYTTHCAFAA